MRLTSALVVVGQILSAAPLLAQDATRAVVKAGATVAADAKRKIAKASVRVNRTVPKASPPVFTTSFGADVTTEALTRTMVFGEPLVPTSTPSPADNRAMATLISTLAGAAMPQRLLRIEQFLEAHPGSPWRASLLANAGTVFARNGYFSRAAAYWDLAWEMTRDSSEVRVRAIGDYAVGESLSQMVMFGQVDRAEGRLKELDGRDVRGSAGAKLNAAASGLKVLRDHHELALFSGPEALKALLRTTTDIGEAAIRKINDYHPTAAGTSMDDLRALADGSGFALKMVHSATVSEIPVPSIVHFRSQHFSAVTAKEGDVYVLRDPALGGSFRMTDAALRDEASGYFLVAAHEALPADWRTVDDGEAAAVFGHCTPGMPSTYDPPCPNCGGGGPGPPGMPSYSFHPVNASLILEDIPVGYAPPIGPGVSLQLSYNHRDSRLPQTPLFSHVGPLWTFNALSYVTDHPFCIFGGCPPAIVTLRGHGREGYNTLPSAHSLSVATLTKLSDDPPRYERTLPDGTVEVFTQPDRPATENGRNVLLTEVIDPQGHSLTYTYDSSLRLVAITDAIGQVTTLEYTNSNPMLITKVTDPFGRFASINYDASGRIQQITDAAGMTSTFSYAANDFIASMTTPYGTTTFRHEASTLWDDPSIEATDPVGGRERLMFNFANGTVPSTEASNLVPTGFAGSNVDLHKSNSFYWDKLAMALYPNDVTKAVITTWMVFGDPAEHHPLSHNIPHSIKKPLENRVWYRYPGQTGPRSGSYVGRQPSLIGRVLDDGSSQITQMTYNAKGMVTSRIDPLGRQTNYSYDTNGIDLLTVEQVRSGGADVIHAYSSYNSQHLPGTITDAAGQDTDITYNAAGQPLTVTNAKSETTTYTYDTNGYLQTVTGPVSGAITTYTYDAYGRIEGVEDADGYLVLSDYDHLNRLTQRTYPDETTEKFAYTRLSLTEQIDRLGRVTRHFYDGFGRRIATRDPAGRTISQVWCDCGAMEALVDANGNRTRWERDVQGRVTREIRADETTDTHYTYDLAGRLKTITDPKDQLTTHSYNLDDSLSGTAYTNEEIETPNVAYTYDQYYARVATMVDGIGTTSYTYVAPGTNGAGQVATIDGPLTNDTIAYTYDELGRVVQRTINGSANQVDWTFDALGRVTSEENLLGEFAYTYDGVTNRLATVTYPNGQTSTYTYLDEENDHRLQTIHHKYPNATTLSKFDYTYDAVGNILTWRQQADTTAVLWKYGYDQADQLISAVKESTATPATVLQRFAYAYDPAGNRTVEQIDDAVTLSAYDTLNRLTSQAPGGPMVVAGTLNEPGTVTISGKPAIVDANNNFRGTVPTTSGTNTFTIVAKDASGNTTTQQYEVELTGSTRSFAYDANGNLTADGTATFEWDARNLLVGRVAGSLRTEWDRNAGGFTSATRVITNSVVTSEQTAISCGLAPCEERISAGATTRYFPSGRSTGTTSVFYQLDHLSSVRSTSSSAGAILGRADFDPFGRADNVSVANQDVSFASLRSSDDASPDYDAAYRRFSPSLGRWLSEDPMGFTSGSSNWYAYADSQVLTAIDPSGLVAWDVDTKITEVITTMLGAATACKAANPLCGCTTSMYGRDGKCSCVNGAYKMQLQLSYKNPTIHLARDAWTPLWVIRRHEQGHVSDAISVLQNRRVAGEALEAKSYSSQGACERDMNDWKTSVDEALKGATRKRDFLVGKFCR